MNISSSLVSLMLCVNSLTAVSCLDQQAVDDAAKNQFRPADEQTLEVTCNESNGVRVLNKGIGPIMYATSPAQLTLVNLCKTRTLRFRFSTPPDVIQSSQWLQNGMIPQANISSPGSTSFEVYCSRLGYESELLFSYNNENQTTNTSKIRIAFEPQACHIESPLPIRIDPYTQYDNPETFDSEDAEKIKQLKSFAASVAVVLSARKEVTAAERKRCADIANVDNIPSNYAKKTYADGSKVEPLFYIVRDKLGKIVSAARVINKRYDGCFSRQNENHSVLDPICSRGNNAGTFLLRWLIHERARSNSPLRVISPTGAYERFFKYCSGAHADRITTSQKDEYTVTYPLGEKTECTDSKLTPTAP